ncbi:hypothetical protein ABT224_20085 [Streptomyces sp. NPDC001584]|uniref:hypothetical protein n=1 Tax=Streptomyces sp. NPDC001584 TaxID=3154521 RepID=UPI0033193DA4
MQIKDNPDFKPTHVYLEGIDGVFPAYVNPAITWRRHACPFFDLETIRRIAVATQASDSQDVIHILKGGRYPDGSPKPIVARVDWLYVESESLEAATDLIEPTEDGLYDLGNLEWTWHETDAPPAS